MLFEEFEYQKKCEINDFIRHNKKLLGLVEMTSGLVNANFSLPKWQAVKMILFAPCSRYRNKYKFHSAYLHV